MYSGELLNVPHINSIFKMSQDITFPWQERLLILMSLLITPQSGFNYLSLIVKITLTKLLFFQYYSEDITILHIIIARSISKQCIRRFLVYS